MGGGFKTYLNLFKTPAFIYGYMCFSMCVSVSPAVRPLRLLGEGLLLCDGRSGKPADARQRCHDQSTEPHSHTRPMGHLLRGKTHTANNDGYKVLHRHKVMQFLVPLFLTRKVEYDFLIISSEHFSHYSNIKTDLQRR